MTQRQLYASMPVLTHDRIRVQSGVLAHIAQTSGVDILKAERIFHSLRNKGIVIHDKQLGVWHGCATVPDRSGLDPMAILLERVSKLERTVSEQARLITRIRSYINDKVSQ